MNRTPQKVRRHRRKGSVTIQVALNMTMMLGMAALAVDVGALYSAQTELQVSADAAALAAAMELANPGDVKAAAIAKADEYAQLNRVLGLTPAVYPEDVKFGRAVSDPNNAGRYRFDEAYDYFNAVNVHLRHLKDPDPNNRVGIVIPMAFGRALGASYHTLEAKASAVLVPRDISVVVDLSNSMCYDSTLMNDRIHRTDGGYCNLRDVWAALPGWNPDDPNLPREPSRPYSPANASSVDETEYAGLNGPPLGVLSEWGDPLVPGSYNAANDDGLWYIPKYADCTEPEALASLQQRGYSAAEINALLSGNNDSNYDSQWRNRAKVILGLAVWHSGKYGGLDPAGGNGNDLVGELSESSPPSWVKDWNWNSYIGYARSNDFKYRYGPKTFTDYMLASQPEAHSTAGLWGTPQQPLRAVKDATLALRDELIALQSMDQLAIEVFCGSGSNCRHVEDLADPNSVDPNTWYQRQSGNFDVYTNIGGGMWQAIQELSSSRARGAAAKVIVLLSDGSPNRYDDRSSLSGIDQYDDPNNPQSWSNAHDYARAMTKIAAHQNMRVYTISVGKGADRNLMKELAGYAHGSEFYASGDPSTYTDELRAIFQALGGERPVALFE